MPDLATSAVGLAPKLLLVGKEITACPLYVDTH